MSDSMDRGRAEGIGGLFFGSHDLEALAKGYQHHLGIDQGGGPTVFSPFRMDTQYFGSPQRVWMVNFRVRRPKAMIDQLRASGVAVEIDTEVYPNGRFARLHDPDGNPAELWEPAGRDTP
jgi:glyoxylase I family protein